MDEEDGEVDDGNDEEDGRDCEREWGEEGAVAFPPFRSVFPFAVLLSLHSASILYVS